MPHLIKVTNNNAQTIKEMYDGIPYVFAKGDPINVPLEAMKHIFGVDFPDDKQTLDSDEFRQEVFLHTSRRFGWNVSQRFDNTLNRWIMNGEVTAENRKRFDDLTFTPVVYKMVEVVAQNEELAEPREQKKHKKASEGE